MSTCHSLQIIKSKEENFQFMRLKRHIIDSDVKKQRLDTMPGFKFTWYYSGVEVEPEASYLDTSNTKAFVRNFMFCYT